MTNGVGAVKNNDVRFGPSGNDVSFYQQGFKSSTQAPAWLKKLGLTAFEVSFGRGIRMTDKTATEIGEAARENGIRISAHAPYFINLANPDPTALKKSYDYIERSLQLLRIMGGNHLVVHIGSQGEHERDVAIENCKTNLKWVIKKLNEEGGFYNFEYRICIETMGRFRAIGDYIEICDICKIDRRVIPTLDFGHINCILQGELSRNKSIIPEIMDYCTLALGAEKMQNIHIHFSAVKFGPKGELSHTTLDNQKFAIPFAPLGRYIKEKGLEPTIICESTDIMAQDALKLKAEFESLK